MSHLANKKYNKPFNRPYETSFSIFQLDLIRKSRNLRLVVREMKCMKADRTTFMF